MIRNSRSEGGVAEVDERFGRKLSSVRNLPEHLLSENGGANARRFFVERTGIIREPFVNRIDFTHRTFQEFLAARAALDEGDIGMLVQSGHNDQWREVVLLA